ncbi:Mn-dependent transcriptional regulator [Bernardetia litoralis DSM 6794]|uniref:Transcriptional regulator MntR n=1 Tax=Bernardetia litoralis (strain ATCC 23117 / DSM 6794 / NBRC 15988 / NCIMB 1366 / Fx l1 / Sio-4) TaxID=880071 RepID=I4AP97_BERLS|nr:metal-dependent transcriptional regulator [Bernardetia litoralis]AFM05782.1 Mn-dependent transcriptional regulator [Bernardetia litoralis DSM 6794]
MNSQTEENYLKALFKLASQENEINLSELSKKLSVSTPTANSMIKRLYEKEFVIYEKYKPIKLTEKGRKEAALIVRKHRLTEMFLVEKMGFGWEKVHAIAEQIEHIKSPIFFDKMDELLGYPDIDPHGSPIPNKEGQIENLVHSELRLSDCKQGDKIKIVAVSESSLELLQFLNSRKISLGLEVEILEIEKYDGTMKVLLSEENNKSREETLSKIVCEKLYVIQKK